MGKQSRRRRDRRSRAGSGQHRGQEAVEARRPERRRASWWVKLGFAGGLMIAAGAMALVHIGSGSEHLSERGSADANASEVGRSRAYEESEPNDQPRKPGRMARVGLARGSGKRSWARPINRFEIRGRWDHADDVDCYRIPLEVPPTGAVVRVELEPPAGALPVLWVLGQDLEAADVMGTVSAREPGQLLVLPAIGARAWETHYVLCSRSTEARPASPYQLRVATLGPTGPFEFEPNDLKEFASALPMAVQVDGYLPMGDVDWYRLSRAPADALRVELNPPGGVEVELALVGAGEEAMASAKGSDGPLSVESAGASFVRVRALSGGNVDERYTLRTRELPESEP